ncbi:MAG: hypothetical protein WA058_02065 [Minisyncoccia bacterium]
MGFLEDYGRSGASESLDKIPKLAIELGKMNQDAATQRFKAAVDVEQIGMQREKLALDKAKTESDLAESAKRGRILETQAQQAEAQSAWLGKRHPLADHPRFLQLTPSQQKFVMDTAKAEGHIDAEGMASNRGLTEMVHGLETSEKMFDQFTKAGIEDKKKAYREKFSLYQEEIGKGSKTNKDKAAALKADMDMAYNDLSTSIGKADEGIKVVRAKETYEYRMKELQERVGGAIKVAKEKGKFTQGLRDDLTKAMKGAASVEQAIFRLQTAGGMSPEMAAMFPQAAEMMKSGNKDAAIASLKALKKRYDDQITSLGGAQYYNEKPGVEENLVSEIQEYE